jgi:putative alpha-1,2-mannosidase
MANYLLEAKFKSKPMTRHTVGTERTLEAGTMVSPETKPTETTFNKMTGAPFTVYFYGEFSTPPDLSQTFSGVNTDPMTRYQNLANGGISEPLFKKTSRKVTSGPMNNRIGLLLSWNDGPASHITSRVGISSISTDRARSYIQKEIPSWKLNDTVAAAVKEWNTDVFNKIQVPIDDSANMTHVRLLYSSLYFIHLMPSDRTGENPLWDSEEPYWDDFYTMCECIQYRIPD